MKSTVKTVHDKYN